MERMRALPVHANQEASQLLSHAPRAVIIEQYLGQVDKKFLACMMPRMGANDSALVLFDQHAAHERVRLEVLEKVRYFIVQSIEN